LVSLHFITSGQIAVKDSELVILQEKYEKVKASKQKYKTVRSVNLISHRFNSCLFHRCDHLEQQLSVQSEGRNDRRSNEEVSLSDEMHPSPFE
jgi:hypothetical protein